MLQELKNQAALTALNKMLRGRHFDICTVRDVGEMLGVNPRCEEYKILQTLHCIDYSEMPSDLRDSIPMLVMKCLGQAPAYQFESLPTKGTKLALVQ